MKTHTIAIVETNRKKVTVEAVDSGEAVDKAIEMYADNDELMYDCDNTHVEVYDIEEI